MVNHGFFEEEEPGFIPSQIIITMGGGKAQEV
jgi:hypothetical protein